MSKFLKFIVNICLLAAILTAVAILVPPLIGITTTIVDTPSMNTNLPLGSVTYSTEVDVSDIKAGDEILKETGNSSTYAYIVHEADPDAGVFKVVSAMDRNGSEEEIYLRNKVPKVAVMVPLIGYVLIAMHTLEGRIIVGLVVALLIILFILSELWRPVADEDYIDEDLPEEAEEAEEEKSNVTAQEETGIDTEAIKAAVEENQSLVDSENAAISDAAQEAEGGTAEVSAEVDQMIAEARSSARGEMREIKAEEMEDAVPAESAAGEAAAMQEEDDTAEDAADRTAEIARGEMAEVKESAPGAEQTDAKEAAPADETEKPKSRGFLAGVAAALLGNKADASEPETEEIAEPAGDVTPAEEPVRNTTADTAAESSRRSGAAAAAEASGSDEAAYSAGTGAAAAEYTVETPAEDVTAAADAASENLSNNKEESFSDLTPAADGAAEEADEEISFDPAVLGGDAEEIPGEPEDLKRGDMSESEGFEQDAPDEGPVLSDITNEGTQLPGGRFIPTPRPTLDEILESAKNAGAEPRLIKDEATGITVADFSKLL